MSGMPGSEPSPRKKKEIEGGRFMAVKSAYSHEVSPVLVVNYPL
jgi:hypothetical protein